MKPKKIIITALTLIFYVMTAFSSDNFSIEEKNKVPVSYNSSTTIRAPQKTVGFGCLTRIESAELILQFDMNAIDQDYIFGDGGTYSFSNSISFSLKAYDKSNNIIPGIFSEENYTLAITNGNPVAVFRKDLSNLKTIDSGNEIPEISTIVIDDVDADITYSEDCQFNASYNIKYGFDVTYDGNTEIPPCEIFSPTIQGRVAEFSWEHPFPIEDYQLQLLRLRNNDPEKITDETSINAEFDWDKAITLDVKIKEPLDEKGSLITKKDFVTTIIEGTGYYAWRVRPIGTYYPGGKAHGANQGSWSNVNTVETIELDPSKSEPSLFFFTDPNESKNRMYSRVFAEDNKVKEVSSYADGLNNQKQTQTYLPSSDVTIVSQNVIDYSGRASLSTLPIPVESWIDNYAEGFVRSGNELYTASNFATDAKGGQPDLVDENGSMNYYNENPDNRIPNADGYPVTTQVFYNDPLNRLKEQSGVGETFITKTDGSGKTTKYFYGTPSETELIQMFGDEAPDNESVSKLVTIDPNNVASVTYTSLEGNVIATCLSFFEEDNMELEPIDYSPDPSSGKTAVSDTTTNNLKADFGFVSSKRLVLLQSTDLNIDYRIKEAQLASSCTKIPVNCHYTLDIVVHDLQTNTIRPVLTDYNMDDATLDGDYLVVDADPLLNVSPGTYIIEKRLKLGQAAVDMAAAKQRLLEQINPLSQLIGSWLEQVQCSDNEDQFRTRLTGLKDALANLDLENFLLSEFEVTSVNYLPDYLRTFVQYVYKAPIEGIDPPLGMEEYSMELLKWSENDGSYQSVVGDEIPELAKLSRAECCEIMIPVEYVKLFDANEEPQLVDHDGDGLEVLNATEVMEDENMEFEYTPDFEGYAVSFFKDCDKLNGEPGSINSFYYYMDGWYVKDTVPQGTFNLMVYHMLMDNWTCSNPYIDEDENIIDNEEPEYDACGNPLVHEWENGIYSPEALLECWKAQLQKLQSMVGCSADDLFESTGESVSLSDSIDERNGGNKSIHDNHFDKKLKKMFFIKRWIAKRKISKKMRDLQINADGDSETQDQLQVPQMHLVKEFLECTGYSFAKILTPYNPEPLSTDNKDDYDYYETANWTGEPDFDWKQYFDFKLNNDEVDASTYFGSSVYQKSDTVEDYYYIPLSNWNDFTKKDREDPDDKGLFPNIKNPIYAFKYFEYEAEGFLDHQELEQGICYDDPNDCYSVINFKIEAELDGSTPVGMVKIPCCNPNQLNPPSSYEGCYADKNYPQLETFVSINPDDPRHGMVGDEPARWIVNDFTERGRLKCPYDHESWNCGQRYSFYLALKNYIPKPADWDDDYERTCSVLADPTTWWYNLDIEGNLIDESLPEIITLDEANQNGHTSNDFRQYDTVPNFFGGKSEVISYIEWQMAEMRNDCNNGCTEKQSEFRRKILDLLAEKCYDVGGCKEDGDEYQHVIPFEDIAVMVAKLKQACEQQCLELNTYACNDVTSRDVNTPKTVLGLTSSYVKVQYGMGGFPTDQTSCSGVSFPFDDAAKYVFNGEMDVNNDGVDDIFECDMDTYDETEYSWYQYTLMEQAKNWDIDLDIPSKCPYTVIEAELFDEQSGTNRDLKTVTNFNVGDYIKFNSLDFGNEPSKIELRVSVPIGAQGQGIELRLGAIDGTLLGTFITTGTGGLNVYNTLSITASSLPTGVNDLYVIGTGTGDLIGNIDWIRFSEYNNPNGYSDSRMLNCCTGEQDGDTFILRDDYEVDKFGEPGMNKLKVDDPVHSGVRRIKIEYNELEQ